VHPCRDSLELEPSHNNAAPCAHACSGFAQCVRSCCAAAEALWRLQVALEVVLVVADIPFGLLAVLLLATLWRADTPVLLACRRGPENRDATAWDRRKLIAVQAGRLFLDVAVSLPLSLLLFASVVRLPSFLIALKSRLHTPLPPLPRMQVSPGAFVGSGVAAEAICSHLRLLYQVNKIEVSVPTRGRDGRPRMRFEGRMEIAEDFRLQRIRVWVLGDPFWDGARRAAGGMLVNLAQGMLPLHLDINGKDAVFEHAEDLESEGGQTVQVGSYRPLRSVASIVAVPFCRGCSSFPVMSRSAFVIGCLCSSGSSCLQTFVAKSWLGCSRNSLLQVLFRASLCRTI
jgi:hypothetical protein